MFDLPCKLEMKLVTRNEYCNRRTHATSVNKLDSPHLSYIDSCTSYSLIKILLLNLVKGVANGEMGVVNQKWAWLQNFFTGASVPTYTFISQRLALCTSSPTYRPHPLD